MSNIIISYSKDQKNTARKIVSKLENKGYSCWIDSRNIEPGKEKREATDEAIKNASLLIIIYSSFAEKTEEIIEQYDVAFENDIPIIPFVVNDIDITLATQHFFNTHDWINAFDTTFDEAVENLIDLIENDEDTVIEKTQKKQKQTTKTNITQQQKNVLIGVASVIILIIVGFVLFSSEENSAVVDSDKSIDELIVGTWKLEDYNDNLIRNAQEISELQQSIAGLKQQFSLVFNKNKTFERSGFQPQTEKGFWEIDKQKSLLMLSAEDNPDAKDFLQIAEISEEKLILIVAETIDDNQQVETKLTLKRAD